MHRNSKINCIGVTTKAANIAIFGAIANAPSPIDTSDYNIVFSH